MCKTEKHLCTINGLSEAKVKKMLALAKKHAAGHHLCPGSFQTGLQVQEMRKSIRKISTGSAQFDELLGGGIESQSITEFFGEFRTGKTQLCHTLCVTSQLGYDLGGGQGKVLYIDTEGNFRPERIHAIAERFSLEPDGCLENIICCRAMTHEQQMEAITQASALFSETGPFALMIIDSVMAHFRNEFSGRGELAERQQRLAKHLSEIIRVATEYNIAVVIVNQVMADPGAMAMFGPSIKPVGGHILAHASTTRIHLKKGRDANRLAKIFDSPSLPEAEAGFSITEGGIDDPSA
jgi:meiotic recombination protein DMC1